MSVRPAHLSMPCVTPACVDVAEALQRMRDEGHQRVALWGAGDHTRRSLGALFESPIEITAILDDSPSLQGCSVLGWRVMAVEEFLSESDASAVLISTKHRPHVERMWAQRERFEAAGKSLYRLESEFDSAVSDLSLPPVLAITIPKSGTWLLVRLLTLAGFEAYRGQAAMYRLATELHRAESKDRASRSASSVDHSTLFELLPASQITTLHEPRIVDADAMRRFVSTGQCRVVLLIRDPRDVVVSRAHFWKHPDNARHTAIRDLSVRDVMDRVIRGDDQGFAGIRELMESYRSLYESPDVHVIRFEEIVHAASAPQDPQAMAPIRSLLRHCGVQSQSDARLRALLSRLEIRPCPGRSSVTNEWRTEFGPAQRLLFSESAGSTLPMFGYE